MIFLFLFLSAFAFSNMLNSDYQINNDKVYLINPLFNENIKVKDSGNGRYEVTDTGDFNIVSTSERNLWRI